jgi:hypothetical protein
VEGSVSVSGGVISSRVVAGAGGAGCECRGGGEGTAVERWIVCCDSGGDGSGEEWVWRAELVSNGVDIGGVGGSDISVLDLCCVVVLPKCECDPVGK